MTPHEKAQLTVRRAGAAAALLGLPESACPYRDVRKVDGRLTFSRAWRKLWLEGYRAPYTWDAPNGGNRLRTAALVVESAAKRLDTLRTLWPNDCVESNHEPRSTDHEQVRQRRPIVQR